MSLVAAFLAPIALLMPSPDAGGAAVEAASAASSVPTASSASTGIAMIDVPPPDALAHGPLAGEAVAQLPLLADSHRVPPQEQVRIEQRMTVRIVPRPLPMPSLPFDMHDRDEGPRVVERSIGRCVAMSGIAGVQADRGNRLLLFMRDRRIISAALERACRSRDFYSGFYLERSSDGQLCVDRDTLLSRSGVNCKVTRLRQLIEVDD